MPDPYNHEREPREHDELVGCIYILLATLFLAAGFMILYIFTADLP